MKHKNTLSFLPENEIWKMARHVLSALHVLHQKNIIHRDLKSANIFMTEGTYKIADLNVSKLLKHTLAYTQTGTPYYASP
jgi:NIMA (never in mitosis gene a)-related kinase